MPFLQFINTKYLEEIKSGPNFVVHFFHKFRFS